MDARRRRSRERLHRAALELASRESIDRLTATEVARAAGVHRSTFYEHADSPADLVVAALRAELDELRADLDRAADAEVGAAVREVTRAVLAHVERHAPIYHRGLGAGSGPASLQPMLSEHFRESSRALRERFPEAFAQQDQVGAEPLAARAAIAFVADATVGVIEVWLDTEPRAPLDQLVRVYESLLPGWWPGAGGT